jgi:hypothetical protein
MAADSGADADATQRFFDFFDNLFRRDRAGERAINSNQTLIRFVAAVLLLLIALGPTRAQQLPAPTPSGDASSVSQSEPSLLFTANEVAAVRRAIAALKGVGTEEAAQAKGALNAAPKPKESNIFLSALVDFGDGQWTVWANGYRISPGHQPPGFRVVAVKENTVEIVTEGEQPARFQLRPYQTWRAAHHDIVEGIVP